MCKFHFDKAQKQKIINVHYIWKVFVASKKKNLSIVSESP